MKLLISSLVCTLVALHSFAQYSFNQVEISTTSESAPKYYEEVNGVLYFQARSSSEKELWKTDGTQLGTTEVANLNGAFSTTPQSLKSYNGNLIFSSYESATGREIYRSDGTAAGTFLLHDIRPGGSSGMLTGTYTSNGTRETFIDFQNQLFFFGNTGNGVELWKTDGTITGTVSVKNFNTTTWGIGEYMLKGDQQYLGVIYNGELYFKVRRVGTTTYELWKSDGTSAGTVLVKGNMSAFEDMTTALGEIYFSCEDNINGREVWTSNGTALGTTIKFDVEAGSGSSSPGNFTLFNGELIFEAGTAINGGELYKTNGITFSIVKDINPGSGTSVGGFARFFEYNGELYFRAKDGSIPELELWKTDGTLAGTVLAVPFSATGEFCEFLNTALYDNKIFYTNSSQLWYTDGTGGGTQKITNNGNLNDPISQISFLHLFQSNLWFAGANDLDGVEPWYLGPPPPTNVTISSCNSYTVPSGNETYTSSGIYFDTIPNASGDDSILQIDVTILTPSVSSILASSCLNYTSPSGNYLWSLSGIYSDTLTSATGCDSVLTIDLTIWQPANTSISEMACASYTSPSGNYTWTTSGMYNDTLSTSTGCDSVLTIDLTIWQPANTSISEIACASYTSPSGNYTWTTSGMYNDTLSTSTGCDSVITINLTISNTVSSDLMETACSEYTSPSGLHTWSTSGTYTDTLASVNGCDSIITIFLTIPTIDVSVMNLGTSLVANASTVDYQWLDCNDSYSELSAEVNQTYAPTSNGNYAVEITLSGCSDTSDCFVISTIGLDNLGFQNRIQVYPNPTFGTVSIDLIEDANLATILLFDATGRIVHKFEESGQFFTLQLDENPGVYFLEIVIDGVRFKQTRLMIK